MEEELGMVGVEIVHWRTLDCLRQSRVRKGHLADC